MRRLALIAAALAAAVAVPVHAQYQATAQGPGDIADEYDVYDDGRGVAGPVLFNIGGAISMPVGNSGSRFDPGLGFTAGVHFAPPRSPVGLRAEYLFAHHDVEGDVLDEGGLDGDQSLHYGTLNIVARPPNQKRFGFYVIAGGGIYYRNVEVSEFAGVGTTTFCDPYFFVCYPQAVPLENVLGSEDSLDFGLNGGIGVFAMLTAPMRLYFEARYHFIWGPEFESPTMGTIDADGEYIPVVLGLAF